MSGAYLIVLPWELQEPGGVNNVVDNLLRRFESGGPWAPLLLIASWSHRELVTSATDRHPVARFRLRAPGPLKDGRSLATFAATLPIALKRLSRFLKEHEVRVVNIHYPTLNSLAFGVLKRFGWFDGALIVSLHGADLENHLAASDYSRSLWRWLVSSADAVVACSEALRRRAMDRLPECADRITAIHNGIDPDVFLSTPAGSVLLPPALQKSRRIVNVGTFEHKKGQDILIRAFERIGADYPDTVLVLVGRTTDELESIRRSMARHPFGERIHLFENVPAQQIRSFLSGAEVFVLPSRREPFGIVILEAGLCGLPVVATHVGGVPEIITSGETGVLVQPDDPVGLADALAKLLSNPDERSRLGEALRQHVINDFSWERAWRAYIDLAHAVLVGRSPHRQWWKRLPTP